MVHIHDTIETKGLQSQDVPALTKLVHSIVSEPIEENIQHSS